MSITIKELKEFLSILPDEFDDFTLVHGEYGVMEMEEGDTEETYYRMDHVLKSIYVDEEGKEFCFLNQTQDDIDLIMGPVEDED